MKSYLLFAFLFLLTNSVLKAQPTASLEHHPEKGILPFNAPCTDCVEDLAKRTGNAREFFKKEKGGGKTVYRQQSLGDMSFKVTEGYWRTVDPQLKEESANVFAARQQPSPVVIDFQNKITSITNAGKEFRFNKNISLVHVSAAGVETNLGAGNWSHISKTINNSETIFLVVDFYPSVDLEMMASYGRVETNFILKNRLPFADGVLKMKQEIEIPDGLKSDLSATTDEGGEKKKGMMLINDNNGENYFYFRKSFGHDANEAALRYVEMPYSLNNDQLTYFVPMAWLNDARTNYPVTIDPLVSSTNTIPQSAIAGSGYTAVCGTLGCSYFMNSFPTPDSCEITAIYTSFSFFANLPCI